MTIRFAVAALLGASLCGPAVSQERLANVAYPPFRIAAGLYYVGASNYASYLIDTGDGLIVIDGGDAPTGHRIVENIRSLGFDVRRVKILLSTHGHFDHAGGLAELKRESGAALYASAPDGALIARGGRGDVLLGDRYPYEPVRPDVTVTDGQAVQLGGWTLTAHLTPGHTPGCTTWTFAVTVAGKVRQALLHCGSNVLPGYKVGKVETYPGQTADFERSFAFWRSAPCEVFLAPHAFIIGLQAKRQALDAGQAEAFVDPEGCRAFFARSEAAFRKVLAEQNPAS